MRAFFCSSSIYIEREREVHASSKRPKKRGRRRRRFSSFVPRPLLLFFFDIHTYYRPEVCSVCIERQSRGHKCIQEGRLFLFLLLPISLKERKTPTLPIFSQFFFPIFFPRKDRKTKKKDKKERQKENPRKRKERDKNPKSESVLFCVYF